MQTVSGEREQLRAAYGCFPSGVTAICALVDGVPVGMAASSFTSVSMEPPLVSVCVQDTSTTWPQLQGRPTLGISVLAETQIAACIQLSRKTGNRFQDLGWTSSPAGGVFIDGAAAWLECSLHEEVIAGDHAIALLRIHELDARPARLPLVFHGSTFRRLAGVEADISGGTRGHV